MIIRDAELRDHGTLVENCMALAMESEGWTPEKRDVVDAVKAAIEDPRKARYFVLEDDHEIIASLFVTYEWSDWRNGWYWWIQGVYVHPDHRRQGMYTQLYEAVHDAARREGNVRRIRLYVHHNNPAQAAYEAHGMQREPYFIYDAEV